MLKNIVKIQYNSDFTLNAKLPDGYDNQDFIIRLYTTDKASYFEASYLNGEYENCLTDSENNNIFIYVNNHNLQPGCLHIGMQFDYDNTHFHDNVENIITAEETNVYLVKQNANATSAMYVGSALPDFTGSVDFVTQSDLEFELLNYYTKEDIDNAAYISSADLNNYVTEEELNDMGFLSAAQLEAMGYATTDYVDTKTVTKQDKLISGVNIKTVNGYSLLGNGNVSISGISQDDLDNAIAPLVSQEALTETLSNYVTNDSLNSMSYVSHGELNNASYVTQSELNSASYVTESQLQQADYATQSFVDDAIADAITEIDVPTYTSDLTNDSGFITASDLNGYATETYVSDYVAQHAPTPDLSAYVTKTELSGMCYVTESQLQQAGYLTAIPSEYVTETDITGMGYVTSTELNNAGYATETYVSDYVAQHAPTPDLSAYVSYDWLEAQSYLTQNDLTQAGYITQSDLSNAGYATETYVSDYVAQHAPTPDLSAYVTKTELSNASYVTQSTLSNASYATTSQLSNKQDTLVSGTNIKTINNNSLLGSGNITITGGSNISKVTQSQYDAMEQAGTLDPDTLYVITDAQSADLDDYVLISDLNSMSYATTTQVNAKQDALVSGTNIKTINNNSLLGSGNITITGGSSISEVTQAEYDAMEQAGTLDPDIIYVITDAAPTDLSYYALKTELTESLIPNTDATYMLGDASHLYRYAYIQTLRGKSEGFTLMLGGSAKYDFYGSAFRPRENNAQTSGSSNYQWSYTYSGNFIENGTNIKDKYATKTEISNAGYLTSIPNTYATYAAISNMGYLTSANFIYNSSTYTLTISI